MSLTRALLALAAILVLPRAQAYPTFHRLGYLSCNACHHLSTGGGVLTPYGKGIGQTLSAFATSTTGSAEPVSSWFEGMLQTRTILQGGQQGSTGPRGQAFLMQADALASISPWEWIRADIAAGLGLKRNVQGGFLELQPGWAALVVRRALLSVSLSDEFQLSMGRDFLPDGLGIEDHTSYLRARGRRGVYDYPTQLRLSVLKEKWVLHPYLFGPSFEETVDNREWGGGARAEWSFAQNQSVGLSAIFGQSGALRRWVGAAFTRLSISDWNGLIAEYSFTLRSPIDASYAAFGQHLYYVKPYMVWPAWIETGWVIEGIGVHAPFEETGLRTGPSINIRAIRGANLLLDWRFASTQGITGWAGSAQAFLWL